MKWRDLSKLYEAEDKSELGGELQMRKVWDLGRMLGERYRRCWRFCREEGTLAAAVFVTDAQ